MGGVLTELEQRMETVDLDACSTADLKALTTAAHGGRRVIDGYLAQIAAAAKAQETSGTGGPVEEVMRAGGDVSHRQARDLAARADTAEAFPTVGSDLSSGATGGENIDTIARRTAGLSDGERRRLAAKDTEIARKARHLPPERFSRYLGRALRQVKDPDPEGLSEAEQQKAASELNLFRNRDGMWVLEGLLDPERGAELDAVIRAVAARLAGGEPVTPNHRADALHRLVTREQGEGGGLGQPAKMAVGYIVDAVTLLTGPHEGSVAETWAGDSVDAHSLGRLACDADLYAILVDRLGRPGPVGRTRRAATREQRLQLRALYRCCPLDGATPFDRCEIHHVNQAWDDGGDTEIENLLPISQRWHHLVHDKRWILEMAPDRSLTLRRPDGTLEREIPPPIPISRE